MRDVKTINLKEISVDHASCVPQGSYEGLSLCHDKFEIFYVICGSGKYIQEGKEFSISERSLFLSRPFAYKSLIVDEGESFEHFSIKFSLDALSDDCGKILLHILEDESGICFTPASQHAALDSIFDRFYIADSLSDRERDIFVKALLTELVILLCTTSKESHTGAEDTLTTRVSRYINSNLQKDLSLDILSRRFFVNKYYLCRAFKQQSGVSIHSYINQKRVLYAKQLIESGETASRAADRVGFCDYSAFYRAYMKFQGVPPTSRRGKGGEKI